MAENIESQNWTPQTTGSQTANDSYQSYHSMVTKTSQGLSALEEVCGELGMQEYKAQLQKLQEHMQSQVFSVGIMGEFRRGKSTVINALLGAEIDPSDVVPTTAALIFIRWDAATRAEIHFKDGTQKEIPVDDLTSYVTMTTKENADMAASVEYASVYYPCRFCQNGVQIIDTPSLNNDERMSAIAEQVFPTLDAMVIVMSAEIPVSVSEAQFIQKIMLSDMGRVLFVVNKIDYIRKKDRPKLLAVFERKIKESVLEKLGMVYGTDSEEYRGAADKMGGIRIYPISARDALEGRLEGDEELVEESGILEFEAALSKMLTEERGMLELSSPINAIEGIAGQVRTAITVRRESLTMDQQKLEAACEEGMQATAEARDKVKGQIADLKSRASGLYYELLPNVLNAYQSIEQELLAYVDTIEIPAAKLQSEKKAKAFVKEIEDIAAKLDEELNASAQALLVKMQSRVGEDLARLEDAGREIFSGVAAVQQKLTGKSDHSSLASQIDGLASACGLFRIGALVNGWKENGLPGAVVGGGVGLAAGLGTYFASYIGAALVMGTVVLPELPFFPIFYDGEEAVYKLYAEKKIEKFRRQLHEYVGEVMQSVKTARGLEHWLESASSDVYEYISVQMDEEVEATLLEFERNLAQLKMDRQKQAGELGAVVEEMNELESKLDKLQEQIQPVREKLIWSYLIWSYYRKRRKSTWQKTT